MGKKAHIGIKESMPELQNMLAKQKSFNGKKRIRCLIEIKSVKFNTRQELADYLYIHKRTLERWVNNYKSGGIFEMLSNKPKNKQSKIITPIIHQGLKQKVNDPHNPFLGYWDAKNWIQQEYGVEIKYQRIREYLIQHFKTKIKSPRKSHIKKDKQAIEAFLKTTNHIQRT